jgi:hypothetical protein
MRVLNLVLVAATLLTVGAGYLQEKRRLGKIQQMPPARARAFYDQSHRRRERAMIVFTALLVVGAVVALATRPGQ